MAATISSLPPVPLLTDTPEVFDPKAVTFNLALTPFRTQANALAAEAEADRQGAETARTGAEAARTGAETARTGTESARDLSRQYRNESEGFKDQSEIAAAAAQSAAGLPSLVGNALKKLGVKAGEDGVEWQEVEVPEGIISKYEEFTTSGTWTKDPAATWVAFHIVAGGAGDAGSGGMGVYYITSASDSPASSTVTVGAGGLGSSSGSDSSLLGHVAQGGKWTSGTYNGYFGEINPASANSLLFGSKGILESFGARVNGPGGWSYYGGGGGSGSSTASNRGKSIFSGDGGLVNENGTFPGGGGGENANGADGVVRIWQW